MSDLDVNTTADRRASVPRSEDAGPPFSRVDSSTLDEREGLPRGFRMRADAHYVDVLMSGSSGQPVRMVPVDELDTVDPPVDADHVAKLARSIRLHGIVHPLLVRRHGLRYSVIAGRLRLAAARLIMLPVVPCLVHQADEREALALAEADNLTTTRTEPDTTAEVVAGVRQALAFHLAGIRTATEMLGGVVPSMRRSSLDLIHAHGWRAARLVDVMDVLAHSPAPSRRQQPLPGIVEKVVDGFRPEARLSQVTLRVEIADGASSRTLIERDVVAGLAGAVMAMLPLAEQSDESAITLRVGAPGERSIAVDVVASSAQVGAAAASRFFDSSSGERPGGWCAVAGALAARACAERHGGEATLNAHGDPFLRITFGF